MSGGRKASASRTSRRGLTGEAGRGSWHASTITPVTTREPSGTSARAGHGIRKFGGHAVGQAVERGNRDRDADEAHQGNCLRKWERGKGKGERERGSEKWPSVNCKFNCEL